jgi:hypothetical protein
MSFDRCSHVNCDLSPCSGLGYIFLFKILLYRMSYTKLMRSAHRIMPSSISLVALRDPTTGQDTRYGFLCLPSDGPCMHLLGSCVSVGVALVARLPSRFHLTRNCALTMKGLLTNANVPPEHLENNGSILEVADVFVPLLKQPLDYLKVSLYPNIILLFRHTQVTLQLGKRDRHKKLLRPSHDTPRGSLRQNAQGQHSES